VWAVRGATIEGRRLGLEDMSVLQLLDMSPIARHVGALKAIEVDTHGKQKEADTADTVDTL
jgi:hypothetical protein